MQRYHRLRASQRAVEPGQNALSTLLTEQAQRLCDLPNASTAGRSGALPSPRKLAGLSAFSASVSDSSSEQRREISTIIVRFSSPTTWRIVQGR
jgi:hypothetical protein